MMNRELLIECTPDMVRAAMFENGQLCEVHHERAKGRKLTESLFLGRIQSIRPSVGAAFVDIGEALNAFLPLKEGSNLRCGDMIIVQGTAVQAVETKGLRISETINLAGKWLVLVPGAQGVRLSKKIKDADLRDMLLQLVLPLCPEGCGLIVRTASSDVTEEALKEEVLELEQRWTEIRMRASGMTTPGVVYEPLDMPLQLTRDAGNTLTRVVTNGSACAARLREAQRAGWLCEGTLIELYEEKSQLLTDVYALDAQIDKALRKRVWLDCGGYLVFDACEALTVVDVNSGKMTLGRDAEDTALRVNMEAAREVARQLRLRNIGGIVIVDYIDMTKEAHRDQLLNEIKRLAREDRSQVVVGGLTRFGLVEMTRKRRGEQLDKALQTGCRACGGSGRLLSAHEAAARALRQVRRLTLAGQRGPFLIRCSNQTATALKEMTAPEIGASIYAYGENGRHAERFDIEQLDIAALPPKGAVLMKKGEIHEENASD